MPFFCSSMQSKRCTKLRFSLRPGSEVNRSAWLKPNEGSFNSIVIAAGPGIRLTNGEIFAFSSPMPSKAGLARISRHSQYRAAGCRPLARAEIPLRNYYLISSRRNVGEMNRRHFMRCGERKGLGFLGLIKSFSVIFESQLCDCVISHYRRPARKFPEHMQRRNSSRRSAMHGAYYST